MQKQGHYDVLIIGSGAAGLGLALSLADQARVALVSKANMIAGSSQHAQGGIAAVMSKQDSIDLHIQDTLIAGAGLCDTNVVASTVKKARAAITWLSAQGVPFTKSQQQATTYHLAREGGHSHRRIIHAADGTGSAVIHTLADKTLKHPNIDCYPYCTAVDLIMQARTCYGSYLLDNQSSEYRAVTAKITVLATGGASYVYPYTSNPDLSSGDGIAMAWRAGARVANLEFNQFHPTCLYHPQARGFLLTEAIRGEGGVLVLPDGQRFMPRYDARAELAPRDIVARAIHTEIKKQQIACVYLDISHQPATMIQQHFPMIAKRCAELGIDITREPIPVVPAAHYTCGGVMTDLDGQTDIQQLYAIGEVAHTGLHGANRLASNSLLECLVFAASAAQKIATQLSQITMPVVECNRPTPGQVIPESSKIQHYLQAIRETMWCYAGIVRSKHDLAKGLQRLRTIQQEVKQYVCNKKQTVALLELNNVVQVAELIVISAMQRKESRGLHFNVDYPNLLSSASNTILKTPLEIQAVREKERKM